MTAVDKAHNSKKQLAQLEIYGRQELNEIDGILINRSFIQLKDELAFFLQPILSSKRLLQFFTLIQFKLKITIYVHHLSIPTLFTSLELHSFSPWSLRETNKRIAPSKNGLFNKSFNFLRIIFEHFVHDCYVMHLHFFQQSVTPGFKILKFLYDILNLCASLQCQKTIAPI